MYIHHPAKSENHTNSGPYVMFPEHSEIKQETEWPNSSPKQQKIIKSALQFADILIFQQTNTVGFERFFV